MNLIILDQNFDTLGVVSVFNTLIWDRRYYASGLFELHTPAEFFTLMNTGRYLYRNDRDELGVIREVNFARDAKGARTAYCKGYFSEELLNGRVLNTQISLTGTPEAIGRKMVDRYVINPSDADRKIPQVKLGELKGIGTSVTVTATGDNLGDKLYEIEKTQELSHRLRYDYLNNDLIFEVWKGKDRTDDQTENSWAIFSDSFSNAVKVKRAGFGQAYYDAYANTTTTPEKEEITMSNSPLVTYTNITKNKTSPRNHAIDTITIHCIVGQWTAKQGCDYFATTDRECSANYIVGKDGSIGLSVDEADRSWCTSSRENDNRAITIEVASDTEHPYAVTDAAYAALIKLVADICKRNGIKKLVWSTNKTDRVNHANGCNMTVHRDYANKACPGQYLYDRHGAIAAAVNKILGSGTTQAPEAVKGFPEAPFTVRVIIPDLNYRKGPGMSYAVRGQTGKGVFTITEVQDGWGKLKSGAGWIYLENPDYCTIQGVAAKPAEPDPADVLAQEIAGRVKGSGLDPADVLNRTKKILGVA